MKTSDVKKIFKEKSINASYESGKYIAWFPDIEKLLSSLESQEEISPLIEDKVDQATLLVEESFLKKEEEEIEQKDDAEIVEDLEFIENQVELDKIEENIDESIQELEDLELTSVLIDFWKDESWVETNNTDFDESQEEILDIEEVLEEKKSNYDFSDIQYFSENWKLDEDDIEINNIQTPPIDEEVKWVYLPTSLPEGEGIDYPFSDASQNSENEMEQEEKDTSTWIIK